MNQISSKIKLIALAILVMAYHMPAIAHKGTGAAATYSSVDKWGDWSAGAANDCFEGIQFGAKTLASSTGLEEVAIELKNSYDEEVHFTCTVRADKTNQGNRSQLKRVQQKLGGQAIKAPVYK
jgi:hypothetical protein